MSIHLIVSGSSSPSSGGPDKPACRLCAHFALCQAGGKPQSVSADEYGADGTSAIIVPVGACEDFAPAPPQAAHA